MSDDRITLDPPKPPIPESVKGLQVEPAYMSAPRPAFAPKVVAPPNPPRPAVREEPVRSSAPPETQAERPVSASRPAVPSAQQENRERARRIARMKFGFYKLTFGLIFVNGLFFAASYLELPPTEQYWFAWPGGVSLLILMAAYIRTFILKGRSIQAYIDSFLKEIEEREVSRQLDRM